MKKILILLSVFALLVTLAPPLQAKEIQHEGKTYYVVTSTDASEDSGNEVCAKVGKSCIGYTGFTTKICENVHPSATKVTDQNGSKAGFYCDGAPQGGVCAKEDNTCHICPSCNVNADCSTQIGDLYREMYVECVAPTIPATPGKLTVWMKHVYQIPGRWWGGLRSSVARSFDFFREKLATLTIRQVSHVTVRVQGPTGSVDADIPEDSYICEFYQTNKKLATCGALAAADHFCVEAMQSRFATAALCQDSGVIVCSNPCQTNPRQIMPKQCAFDNDRPRGKQAPPLDFCTQTKKITVDPSALGTKTPGQQCAHGGECTTGNCLGQPSSDGIKYFCSCDPFKLDFSSCKK